VEEKGKKSPSQCARGKRRGENDDYSQGGGEISKKDLFSSRKRKKKNGQKKGKLFSGREKVSRSPQKYIGPPRRGERHPLAESCGEEKGMTVPPSKQRWSKKKKQSASSLVLCGGDRKKRRERGAARWHRRVRKRGGAGSSSLWRCQEKGGDFLVGYRLVGGERRTKKKKD